MTGKRPDQVLWIVVRLDFALANLDGESSQRAIEVARSRTPDDSAVVTIEWMSKKDCSNMPNMQPYR